MAPVQLRDSFRNLTARLFARATIAPSIPHRGTGYTLLKSAASEATQRNETAENLLLPCQAFMKTTSNVDMEFPCVSGLIKYARTSIEHLRSVKQRMERRHRTQRVPASANPVLAM